MGAKDARMDERNIVVRRYDPASARRVGDDRRSYTDAKKEFVERALAQRLGG